MAPTARNLGERIAWQLANKHCDAVFELIQSVPCRRDVTFCEQIRDASSAVAPLIAEGFVQALPAWRISKRVMKATSRLLNAKLQQIAEEERN